MKKLLLLLCVAVVLAVGAGFGHFFVRYPRAAPAADIRVEATPERVARGKHLFEHVADCDGCHSEHDYGRMGSPVIAGRRGVGMIFPDELALPGRIVAPNITSDRATGIGAWTDGEIIRAIREGIGRDGQPLFPFMPYEDFRRMSDEDVHSLVAYLRTLPAVENRLPRTSVRFPVNVLMRTAPQPVGQVAPPDPADKVQYGEYLVTMGSCRTCHTKLEDGKPTPGVEFAGGEEFRTPVGVVVSANITPEPETGIGSWSEEFFIGKFYQYRDYVEKGSPQVGRAYFTLMPWLGLSQLSREELGAIYAYLRTQKPVVNKVETHPER